MATKALAWRIDEIVLFPLKYITKSQIWLPTLNKSKRYVKMVNSLGGLDYQQHTEAVTEG